MTEGPDVVVIGSGMGGATLAAALAPTGRRIVILERGERLADCAEARDEAAIFARGHFRPKEEWATPGGEAFNPGNYYYVGGNTKLYGAVLLRYRAEDFRPLRHLGGTTPGWPVAYDEMEPWYQAAEELYGVRGDASEDPTEPPHSGDYPFGPVPDEPAIAAVRARCAGPGCGRRRCRSGSTSSAGWRARRRRGPPSPIPPAPRATPRRSGSPGRSRIPT
jgi:choline dehydrogenase-like flavoprotein